MKLEDADVARDVDLEITCLDGNVFTPSDIQWPQCVPSNKFYIFCEKYFS